MAATTCLTPSSLAAGDSLGACAREPAPFRHVPRGRPPSAQCVGLDGDGPPNRCLRQALAYGARLPPRDARTDVAHACRRRLCNAKVGLRDQRSTPNLSGEPFLKRFAIMLTLLAVAALVGRCTADPAGLAAISQCLHRGVRLRRSLTVIFSVPSRPFQVWGANSTCRGE